MGPLVRCGLELDVAGWVEVGGVARAGSDANLVSPEPGCVPPYFPLLDPPP
jgi:hypothetical protein